MLIEERLIQLANELDNKNFSRLASKVESIVKTALNPKIEEARKEMKLMENPLPMLHNMYLDAINNTTVKMTEMFGGDSDRAKHFVLNYPNDLSLPTKIEDELVDEFGQKAIDYYIYGIGDDSSTLTEVDIQNLLLDLLESHYFLRRRRDKKSIRERFDIYGM